jgi:hypothetical protein
MDVVGHLRYWFRRHVAPVGGIVKRHSLIMAFMLALLAAGLANIQLLIPPEPAPSNWSGFLQYSESQESSVPTGRIVSNSFEVNQNDLTPSDQNLSISSWNVSSVFMTAYGAGSGLQITARDQGNYSSAPYRTTAKLLTEPYVRPIDISYAFIHVSNFGISAFSPSQIITSLGPWSPARYPLFFLRLGVAGSGSSPFFMTYHYTPSSSQSMIELHATGVSLPGPNSTTVNLTGNAVVEMTSFSEATIGLWEYSQMLPFLFNSHVKFQAATVKIWNATGYLIDQAGKADTPNNSSLDFGRAFSFQLDLMYPTSPIRTVGISSVAASLVDAPRGGTPIVPEQQTVEGRFAQFARLAATGLASFASGVFASIGLTRRRGRPRWGS